jgi:hypothetical protein
VNITVSEREHEVDGRCVMQADHDMPGTNQFEIELMDARTSETTPNNGTRNLARTLSNTREAIDAAALSGTLGRDR